MPNWKARRNRAASRAGEAAAPQAATPRLCPPAHDAHPAGGARAGGVRDGERSRLRDSPDWGLDSAHSGSHRVAGGSGTGHRARPHCSDLPGSDLPGADLPGVPAPLHAPGGTGRCGFGTAAPRRQPAQPGRHATGRSANALPHHPAVSGYRTATARQRGRHRRANGYVWTFSTPTERYFLRRGRGKTVVDEALSDAFSGVLVSDCYAAYHHYDGPKQRCWAHLLRDIHDLQSLYPEDESLSQWSDAVHGTYDRAKACTPPQAKPRRTAQLALERQLWPSANPSGTTRRNPGQAVPTH